MTATLDQEADLLTAGVYLPGRAGALAGVSGKSIGQWARNGLVTPTVYEGRPANLYSYFDVAEAIVVRWLLAKDFQHKEIRAALRDVRGEWPQWPLLNAPLGIGKQSADDRGGLVRQEGPDVYVDIGGRAPGQVVIKPLMLDHVRDMLHNGGWLANALGLKRIEVQPTKLGGQPSLKERRWTVDHVAQIASDAQGRSVLEDGYGLASVEVDESVSWVKAAAALA